MQTSLSPAAPGTTGARRQPRQRDTLSVLGGVCRVCVCHTDVCLSQDTHDARAQRPPSDMTFDPWLARSAFPDCLLTVFDGGAPAEPRAGAVPCSAALLRGFGEESRAWGSHGGRGRRLGEQPEASARPCGHGAGG